jgi:hypothetical protein
MILIRRFSVFLVSGFSRWRPKLLAQAAVRSPFKRAGEKPPAFTSRPTTGLIALRERPMNRPEITPINPPQKRGFSTSLRLAAFSTLPALFDTKPRCRNRDG